MERFGAFAGQAVELIRLQTGGLACELLTYGATLRALYVPDRQGRRRDVVLGFDRLDDYVNHNSYFGAVVGPNANRIAKAACTLGGQRLRLDRNDGTNSLHSGAAGLDRRLWEVVAVSEEAVTLGCTHPDGLGGIPGELRIRVTYRLEETALVIDYRAISQRDTLCNLTNHSYFNLDGHGSGSVLGHRVQLFAERFTPTDVGSLPTGELRDVAGTPMDLRQPVRVGDRIDAEDAQLRQARGFDHNWVLSDETGLRPAARAWGAESGIVLTVCTDRPGVQFYTGNYIPSALRGKGGAVYGPRQGLCFETQAFPDAPNHPNFPTTLLRAGQEWHSRTVFQFRTE